MADFCPLLMLAVGAVIGALLVHAGRQLHVSPNKAVRQLIAYKQKGSKHRPEQATAAPRLSLHGRPHPRGYVAYRAPAALELTGRLDHPAWQAAPWTDDFQDIMGPEHTPQPWLRTRAKMLWDDTHLYVGAQLEDPRPFANEALHDEVIFRSNDFEIFIDPDGDNWMYYEIEINARGALWDLLLVRPYRNGGPAVHSWESIAPSEPTIQDGPTGWAPLRRVVHVDGALNNGSVASRGWSVEVAIPWSLLAHVANRPSPPRVGDKWRINFSRVHWNVTWDEARQCYVKDPPNQAESNWVWAAQYAVAMHQPETWGYVQFAGAEVASAAAAQPVAFAPDPSWPVRAFLMDVYAAQQQHWKEHGRFARTLVDLGLRVPPPSASCFQVEATQVSFVASADVAGGGSRVWVNEQGRLTQLPPGQPFDPADGNSRFVGP